MVVGYARLSQLTDSEAMIGAISAAEFQTANTCKSLDS
jgi:hypothetical protein